MAISIEQLNANRAKLGLPAIPGGDVSNTTNVPKVAQPVNNDFVSTMVQSMGKAPAPEQKKGFVGRVGDVISSTGERRGTEVLKSIKAFQRGDQSLTSTLGQATGQVLGGASDILGAGAIGALKFVTPKPIEKAVSSGTTRAITSLMGTRPGQFVARQTQKLEADTEKTRNIKAFLGAGSLGLDATGVGLSVKPIKSVVSKVGSVVEKVQEARLPAKIAKTQSKTLKLYERATDVAPSAKKDYEQRFKEPLAQYLQREQIPFDVKGQNQLDTAPSIEKINKILDIEEDSLQKVLATKKTPNDVFDIRKTAERAIAESANTVESADIAKNIKKFLLGRKEKVLLPDDFNELKRQFNKYYDKADSAKNEAARTIQRVMRNELLEKYPTDKILENTLARMSRALEAKDVLIKMADKTLRGGKLGRQLSQIVGAATLGKIPVLGPLIGYELAGRLTDYMLNPSRLTSKAIAELKKMGIIPQTLQKREEVLNYLMKDLVNKLKGKDSPLLLPEARPDTPRAPINIPEMLESTRQRAIQSSGVIEGEIVKPLAKEARPGQILLPERATPKPIITTPPTQFDKPASKIGNAFTDRLAEIQRKRSEAAKKAWETRRQNSVKDIDVSDDLMKEAKKYKSADEFVRAQETKSYRSVHQVNTKTASPITEISERTLNDFIDEFRRQYGYPGLNSKEVNKLKSIMTNPDKEVTIYRASPKNELNSGDWVTIDKVYANNIKRQNGGKVYTYTVKAGDLFYPNTIEGFNDLPSLNKWGAFQYQDSAAKSQLTDIWNKANKKQLPNKLKPLIKNK